MRCRGGNAEEDYGYLEIIENINLIIGFIKLAPLVRELEKK